MLPQKYSQNPLYILYNMKQKLIESLSMHNGDNFANNKVNFRLNQSEFVFNIENYFKKLIIQRQLFSNHVGMFILDLHDNLYLNHNRNLSRINHPLGHIDLSLGADCLCAGTLHFDEKGVISEIALDSGHYRPTWLHGMYFLNFLFKKYIMSQTILPYQGIPYFEKMSVRLFFKNNDQAIKNAFQRLNIPGSFAATSLPIAMNGNPNHKNEFVSRRLSFKDFVKLASFL